MHSHINISSRMFITSPRTYVLAVSSRVSAQKKISRALSRTYSIRFVNRTRASQARTWAWIRVAAASLRFSCARSSRAAFFCCRKLPFDDEPSAQNILESSSIAAHTPAGRRADPNANPPDAYASPPPPPPPRRRRRRRSLLIARHLRGILVS